MVFSDLHVVKSNGQLSCLTFTIFHNLHHGTFQEMFFLWGFPHGAIRGVKNLTVSAEDVRDMGSIPGMGRSLGGRNGNPLQYTCLENPRDRGAWLGRVRGVTESDKTKQLSILISEGGDPRVSFWKAITDITQFELLSLCLTHLCKHSCVPHPDKCWHGVTTSIQLPQAPLAFPGLSQGLVHDPSNCSSP